MTLIFSLPVTRRRWELLPWWVSVIVALIEALAVPAAFAQDPAWQAAVALSQPTGAESYVTATTADASGNVYVAGYFTGTITLSNTTLTSAGSNDVFVAKWNTASVQFVWAQRAGGTGDDQLRSLSIAGASVYLVGDFTSPTFGFGTATLSNSGSTTTTDVFVAKLLDTGPSASYGWVQRVGSSAREFGNAIAVSGTSVYIAGWFDGSQASFGSISLLNSGPLSYPDLFVAKLTDTGTTASFTWAQRAGGAGDDVARSLAVSGTSVYVAGFFDGRTADFGSTRLTNSGNTNVFVAKLTDAGSTSSFTWAQQAGGAGTTQLNALAVSGTSLYITGALFTTEPNLFGTTTLTSTGESDVFVAKLTDRGNTGEFTWAQRAGGAGKDVGTSLAVNGSSVYVGGAYTSAVATFGTSTLSSAGDFDVFVAKLTDSGSAGAFTWAQGAGGSGPDYGYAVEVTGTSVYVAGSVKPPTRFGGQTLATPVGTQVGFLASLTDSPVLAVSVPNPLTGVALSPNPTHSAVTVFVPAGLGLVDTNITLLDVVGRLVCTRSVRLLATGLQQPLSLVGLPPGLYAVRVQVGTTQVVRRLVIN
jgi:hypothetical protein